MSLEENMLSKLMTEQTFTLEDRYRVLDARDKIIRQQLRKSIRSKLIKGTCPDMCPEKERLLRELQHQVSFYEKYDNCDIMNNNIAVKQYIRSSADQEFPLAHELRPVSVLKLTMNYLLQEIIDLCERSDTNLSEWYIFLWNRTRAIRKDITQQDLCCPGSVELIEQCARFHIHCSARLVAEDIAVFDEKINSENLTKCLQTLKYMYHDLRVKHIKCANEAEFRSYIILLNLNDANFLWELQQLSPAIQRSEDIKFAINVYLAIEENNYVKFFNLVRQASYLNSCILMRYFIQVRNQAIIRILKAFSPRSAITFYPLDQFWRILGFECVDDAIDFIDQFGLLLSEDRTSIVLDRKLFEMPDIPLRLKRSRLLVESKRIRSVAETVYGGSKLPSKDYIDYEPFDSFDRRGFLKPLRLDDYLAESEMETDVEDEEMVTENGGSEEGSYSGDDDVNEDVAVEVVDINDNDNSDNSDSKLDDEIMEIDQDVECFGKKINSETRVEDVTDFVPIVIDDSVNKFVTIQPSDVLLTPEKPTPFTFPFPTPKKPPSPKTTTFTFRSPNFISVPEEPRPETKNVDVNLISPRQAYMNSVQAAINLVVSEEPVMGNIEPVLHERELELALMNMRLEKYCKSIKYMYKLYYFISWRQLTATNRKKRRQVLQNVITGMPKRPLKYVVNEFQFPNFQDTLHIRKRYKYGEPINFMLEDEYVTSVLNVKTLIYRILRTKYESFFKKNSYVSTRNIFWKIGISFPDSDTVVRKSLSEFLQWGRDQNLLKNETISPLYRFVYCLKSVNNFEPKHGLIFIESQCLDSTSFHKLETLFTNTNSYENIPLAIIIRKTCVNIGKGDEDKVIDLLYLNLLQKSKKVSEFKIFFELQNDLQVLVVNALKFLAENVSEDPPLLAEDLMDFLSTQIGQEFWMKITQSSHTNRNLERIFQHPNAVIDLYNDAVDNLTYLVFDETLYKSPDFPSEFKPFLERDTDTKKVPKTYHYFPSYWKDFDYIQEMNNRIESLYLPKYRYEWPPKSYEILYDDIFEYCDKDLKADLSDFLQVQMLSIIKTLTDVDKDFNNFANLIKDFSWLNLICIPISAKRRQLRRNIANEKRRIQVMYNVHEMNYYNRHPWWYESKIVNKHLKQLSIAEQKEVRDEPEKLPNNFDLDFELEKIKISRDKTRDLMSNCDQLNDVRVMRDDLTVSVQIGGLIDKKFKNIVSNL